MVVLGFPVVDIMKVIGKMHRVHMENLELTQLRLVEAIAETGNLSSAAEVVGLSQSAASHSLARLRKETGDPLFVRTSQRMQPTPYGEQLCAAVHNALLLLREGLRGGRSFVPADASRIFSLYMSEAGQLTMLPQLLAYLREQAPGVRIHVSRLPEKNQGSALSICLSFNTRPRSGNFRLTSLFGSMGWIIKANVSTYYHDSNAPSPGRGYNRLCRLADLNL